MKVIIAGSRSITSNDLLEEAVVSSGFCIQEVVSGGAQGVDALGESFAKRNNIALKIFPADWDLYGKSAGPIRNSKMAEYADALIALWDGKSRGTKNMIDLARRKKLKVFVVKTAS